MLTVDEYARIRRAHRDGMSIRAIARTFHHTRRKIREVLCNPQPKPYTRVKEPPAPVLGPFWTLIDQILAADEQAPPKQRHTAAQIHRRLVQEYGYLGSYDQVRRYVRRNRRSMRETFIPLAHDAGQRAEADFGHIWVDFPEGRRLVPVGRHLGLLVPAVRDCAAHRADRGDPARAGAGLRILRLCAQRIMVG